MQDALLNAVPLLLNWTPREFYQSVEPRDRKSDAIISQSRDHAFRTYGKFLRFDEIPEIFAQIFVSCTRGKCGTNYYKVLS